MFSVSKRAALLIAAIIFALSGAAFAAEDDDTPDVTARVARISALIGDVQVRHAGEDDWEKAVQNLPVVEGDELTASDQARFEIQFDSRTFVRVAGSSVLRIITLKDEGIALSLPEGSISVRVNNFDKDRSFFEVDIPRSTIAIQRSGLYRIDPGAADSIDAHVRVTDGGEARIYSESSGFTLKSGRAATVFLSGDRIGEWETADASPFTDDFDTWTLDRDSAIARQLKDAYYDKYYDRDMYGAEDLNSYGDWIYTNSYGYVWRPYRSSLSAYTDWSPYRYGHWRWLPPFGWTWINDEPWGWATYHWGRWVWDDGYWYWAPYGYYRFHRSWWQPALVIVTIINSDVCWYPLPYNYHYYSYNRHFYRRWDGDGRGGHRPPPTGGGGTGGGGVNPSPTPRGNIKTGVGLTNEERRQRAITPPFQRVPANGVVSVSLDEFGRSRGGIRRAPVTVAQTVLSKAPDTAAPPPVLPTRTEVGKKMDKAIVADTPPIIAIDRKIKTGAGDRSEGKPLDMELRRTRILGNRNPVTPPPLENTPVVQTTEKKRDTGAVTRPVKKIEDKPVTTIQTQPAQIEKRKTAETPPWVPPVQNKPVDQPRQKIDVPRREVPRYEPPKSDTPTRRDPPPVVTPKSEPRSQPKQDKPVSPPPKMDKPKKPDS